MRTLAFDGRMGASGDMLLGALLAAGADRAALASIEDALEIHYAVEGTVKNGIEATGVDVLSDGHEHAGNHDHDHSAEGSGPHRSYREVVEIVESMGLDPGVERDATAIFEILGEAEASVHGEDLETIHFHEVGADDAIADIAGVAALVADLDPDRVVTTPLSTGSGEVSMSHGTYPVPGPAVTEIAERADWLIRGGPIEAELLTPTGAAILARLADGVETLPELRVEGSGYGAGDADFPDRPNVLRAITGESEGDLAREGITVLETNLDDASPEVLGGLQDTLIEVGARDVTILPATMKKSRPGHLVKVICRPEDARQVARRLAEETGTLGVRATAGTHRWVADRRIDTVEVGIENRTYGIDVKVASDETGEVYDVSPEYDDAARVAAETGRPIREVMHRAETAWRD